jgi:molybdopterin-guanine dinucleotide biosynthesis protein A
MNAIVICGGTPGPDDPLYAEALGRPKSLIEIAGKPMAQWVLEALDRANGVERLVLVGVEEKSGLSSTKIDRFVPDQGGLLSNVLSGMSALREIDPGQALGLLVSSDVPSITSDMIEWRARVALEASADLDYAIVERSVMEARFPQSNRSYIHLKGLEVCGGDVNAVRLSLAADEELWSRITEARKSAFRQAALLGFDTLFLLATRLMSLERGERMVSKRLKLNGRVHLCPYAEIAMDVDKPHQLEIIRRDLEARGTSAD